MKQLLSIWSFCIFFHILLDFSEGLKEQIYILLLIICYVIQVVFPLSNSFWSHVPSPLHHASTGCANPPYVASLTHPSWLHRDVAMWPSASDSRLFFPWLCPSFQPLYVFLFHHLCPPFFGDFADLNLFACTYNLFYIALQYTHNNNQRLQTLQILSEGISFMLCIPESAWLSKTAL